MGYVVDEMMSSSSSGWWHRRRGRILQRDGELDCLLRVIDGEQPGLTRKWSHGRARLALGRIDFIPRSRDQREAVAIEVLRVPRNAWREVGFRESMTTQQLVAVKWVGTVRTPTAVLDWGIPERQRTWAAQLVDPRDGAASERHRRNGRVHENAPIPAEPD